jgi:hypothetical protein
MCFFTNNIFQKKNFLLALQAFISMISSKF